ncbi:MAG TPA: DUF488 domain-containing protein [Thermodesulfovibrionales bacterium]|nr:DUF488 domain-containing protein [Thermodesulfovibrionales bacterium]
MVKIKRIYDPASPDDGKRILVDRLWPRGIKKEEAGIDEWMKEIAPSGELRKWFGHDPSKWEEFRKKYRGELKGKTEFVEKLAAMAKKGKITLLFSAKDREHNNAVVIKEAIDHQHK